MSEKSNCDYEKELVKNGVIAFVPSGNSMWPTLKHRKQSVIVKLKTEKLKPMDVALYRREDGANVLHRVMRTTDFGYIMCGDSLFSLERVKEDSVYGVMVGFYRGKRYVEVTDADYIDQIKKWYANEKLRKFRVKTFYFFEELKSRIAGFWHKIFRRKRKDEGEMNND